jgi:hypothetical protein
MKDLKRSSVDVNALLRAEESVARVVTAARVALSQRDPPEECTQYFAALDRAVQEEPPPFGTKAYSDIYRGASANGQWMAMSLITNAEREGDGATRLWSLAACSVNVEERQLLKRHAIDESRHALAYLALLDLCFPNAVTPAFRSELNGLSPHYSIRQQPLPVEGSPYARTPSIDDFMQMNIAEIRTTIHHLMQRLALAAHCPPQNRRRATRILDSLLRDELSHVAYTAVLIEQKASHADPDEVQDQFCKRLHDFNRITNEELGQMIFD